MNEPEQPPKTPDQAPEAEARVAKIVRGKKTYTPEVLAKKKELALKALEHARKANEQNKELQQKEKAAKELEKEALRMRKEEDKKSRMKAAESKVSALTQELQQRPKSTVSKAKRDATPVYDDSSDSASESDGDDFVLVKKRLVKKYREIKRNTQPSKPQATPYAKHEVSEKLLADRWASDRYRLMLSSMFPNHNLG